MQQTRLLVLLSLLTIVAAISRTRRVKRQDYQNPFISDPLAGRPSSDLAPIFPFVHTFNNGLLIDPADDTEFTGKLNLPIPGWGLFDISGKNKIGLTPGTGGYGHVLNPIDTLNLGPNAITRLAADPSFTEARDNAPSTSLGNLPGGFEPLRCRPPFCNPFVSTIGIGTEIDLGANADVSGELDFPIPVGPNGLGVRFPLDGSFTYGTSNIIATYGQNISPYDAVGVGEKRQEQLDRQEQDKLRRELLQAQRALPKNFRPQWQPQSAPQVPQTPQRPFVPPPPPSFVDAPELPPIPDFLLRKFRRARLRQKLRQTFFGLLHRM